MANKKTHKIGVLNVEKVKHFLNKQQHLQPYDFKHPQLTRKIIGHVLNLIRKQGASLYYWDNIEIDMKPESESSLSLDIHFVENGKPTHTMYGLELDLVEEKIGNYEMIGIHAKN